MPFVSIYGSIGPLYSTTPYYTTLYVVLCYSALKKGKVIPVTGRRGPQDCETPRLPRILDNCLKDGGEVVSITRLPPFTNQEDSWYSFLLEAESTQRT
jgi:hypothetical protein